MVIQIFVKRIFTIFATNASFLRVIANLLILFSIMQYILCNSVVLDQETLFLTQKKVLFCPKIYKKRVNLDKS